MYQSKNIIKRLNKLIIIDQFDYHKSLYSQHNDNGDVTVLYTKVQLTKITSTNIFWNLIKHKSPLFGE